MPDVARYRFGPFLLEPALRRLMREGSEITLPPKAFDLLVVLVRARDRVLPKQALLDAVWPDTAVTENTLTQRIREIRDALGDDAQDSRYLKTVSRVGYRFVGNVVEESSATPDGAAIAADGRATSVVEPRRIATEGEPPSVPGRARRVDHRPAAYAAIAVMIVVGAAAAWFVSERQPPAVPAERRIASIAVLPLDNLSDDAAEDYFADGMTDQLITELARIPSLRVISRTSARRYRGTTKSVREIGDELNVDAVVEGSVLRAGQQVRVTLKLVDVVSDRTLLAESHARDLQDVLALQSEIARAVAGRIRITVAPDNAGQAARRVIPEAFDDYLKGRSAWWTRTPEGVKEALLLFQRAIDRDATFAAAWAGVADCYIVFSGALLGLAEHDAYPKAREAVMRALALDDTLAEAHTSLGSIKSEYDWDWPGAEAEYTRAIALNSSYVTARQWYGEFLYFRGRHQESVAQLEYARQLDPLSPVVNDTLAIALLLSRRYDEAAKQALRTLEIDPDFPGAYLTLGSARLQQGRHADAIESLETARRLSPDLSRPVAWLGHAYGVAGHRDDAQRMLEQLQAFSRRGPVSPYDFALVHVGLGDSERSLSWLERAYEARAWDLIQLQVDMRFDSLRDDPRFGDLIRRIGSRRRS
jgi:TolB-like protein/DNA-binding winged helix-turn-helix (wHTH) protein/Tfp pilus assembly protein PilF